MIAFLPGSAGLHAEVVDRARLGGALGLVLTGSTARGRRTDISDLDYHLVVGESIDAAQRLATMRGHRSSMWPRSLALALQHATCQTWQECRIGKNLFADCRRRYRPRSLVRHVC